MAGLSCYNLIMSTCITRQHDCNNGHVTIENIRASIKHLEETDWRNQSNRFRLIQTRD